jgi:hypothetical protein
VSRICTIIFWWDKYSYHLGAAKKKHTKTLGRPSFSNGFGVPSSVPVPLVQVFLPRLPRLPWQWRILSLRTSGDNMMAWWQPTEQSCINARIASWISWEGCYQVSSRWNKGVIYYSWQHIRQGLNEMMYTLCGLVGLIWWLPTEQACVNARIASWISWEGYYQVLLRWNLSRECRQHVADMSARHGNVS